MPSGGNRPGSGRPPGSKTRPKPPATKFDDPLTYLIAVSRGEVEPDALRITAAKAALPYVAPKMRLPVESPPAQKLRKQSAKAAELAEQEAWRAKSAAIRRKHGNG